MSDTGTTQSMRLPLGERLVYWLAFGFVIVGMLNSMPGIPGLDSAMTAVSGWDWFIIRRYPYEYFYPLVFAVMMIIVALKHSLWRELADADPLKRRLGLAMDLALVVAALSISLTYLTEIESVCMIDQFTGERAALIAKSLAAEKELAELYGLPVPSSVENPQCINTTGVPS